MLRSNDTKEKLSAFKEDFLLTKEEFKTYLAVCHIKLSSSISTKVDDASGKLDEILSVLNQSNRKEDADFWDYVNAQGGTESVINVCLPALTMYI
jgi:hypothetical protein